MIFIKIRILNVVHFVEEKNTLNMGPTREYKDTNVRNVKRPFQILQIHYGVIH
jgi:hypothetical protein